MRFAKNCFDVGLMINQGHFRLADWTDGIGLELDHIIEVEGLVQHRFQIGGAVLKVNVAAEPLPSSPRTGFVSFVINGRRFGLRDGSPFPDGSAPTSTVLRQDGLHVEIASPSVDRAMRFYIENLGLEEQDSATVRCGTGYLNFRVGETRGEPALIGTGMRYITLQVFDADSACSEVVAKGGTLGREPVSYGDVARYGFVRDPDGNWIELSARASVIANQGEVEPKSQESPTD